MTLTTMTFIDDLYTHALLTDLFRPLGTKADALAERNALVVFNEKPRMRANAEKFVIQHSLEVSETCRVLILVFH